jgi:hypothetical protein
MPDTTIIGNPLLRGLATPLRGVYYPLGFPLEVESNDARVLAHATATFGIFREGAEQDPPMRIKVVCDPNGTAGPPWPAHSFRGFGDVYTVVGGAENFMVCDLERRQATAFFSPAFLQDRDYFCTTFLEGFVYMTIQRHWATPMHAACVVRDGCGICLAGDSTAGKSTLAYYCAKSGYGLLADNGVWLLNATENRSLLGNPSRLRLRLTARDLFPEVRGLPVSRRANGEDFLAVPIEQMLPRRWVTRAEPGPIVFLDRRTAPTPTVLEPVSPEEAFRRVFFDRSLTVDEPHVIRASERTIREAVRGGAYSMRYTSLEQALECLNQIPLTALTERTAQ